MGHTTHCKLAKIILCDRYFNKHLISTVLSPPKSLNSAFELPTVSSGHFWGNKAEKDV